MFEVLPLGTGVFLNRLGYWLTPTRAEWEAREGVLGVRGPVEVLPAVRMTVDQLRYRRHQALFIRKYGKKFFEGESDEEEEG